MYAEKYDCLRDAVFNYLREHMFLLLNWHEKHENPSFD